MLSCMHFYAILQRKIFNAPTVSAHYCSVCLLLYLHLHLSLSLSKSNLFYWLIVIKYYILTADVPRLELFIVDLSRKRIMINYNISFDKKVSRVVISPCLQLLSLELL